MTVLCSDKTGTLTTADMRVLPHRTWTCNRTTTLGPSNAFGRTDGHREAQGVFFFGVPKPSKSPPRQTGLFRELSVRLGGLFGPSWVTLPVLRLH